MDISTLHTNQRLLVEALIKKGASVRLLDSFEELIEVSYNGKIDFLMDRFSSVVPYHVVKMTADKFFAKKRLTELGINTPIGSIFTGNTINEAITYAETIFPIVLKPNWGSHGDHVQVNICNQEELKTAIHLFINNTHINEPFIIEKFHPWKEYRLFITKNDDLAVVHRECASVIGDGKSSLIQLIEKENIARIILKKSYPTSICPIVIDTEVERYLQFQHIDNGLQFIPELNQKIFLRNESNLAKGGKAIDMTDIIHPSIKLLAIKALKAFPGLPVAGLDLLCKDISQEINEDYVIIEVNSNPGLSMHTYPTQGQSQNVAEFLLKVMFPDF